MTTTASPPGSGTGSVVSVRQSIRSAWPATPAAQASWSSRPVAAPTQRFSARWASSASSVGEGVNPARCAPVRATASSSAAEEDSPAPTGMSLASVPRQGTGPPPAGKPDPAAAREADSAASITATPSTYRTHPGARADTGVSRPGGGSGITAGTASCSDTSRSSGASLRRKAMHSSRSMATGRQKPSL